MDACIRKRVVYDMSCKRFQFFVTVEALSFGNIIRVNGLNFIIVLYMCFGTCKTEVQENIFYFQLRWPANYFIFHNFVYTD